MDDARTPGPALNRLRTDPDACRRFFFQPASSLFGRVRWHGRQPVGLGRSDRLQTDSEAEIDEDRMLAREHALRDQGALWGLASLGIALLAIGWATGAPSRRDGSAGLDCPRPRAVHSERGFTWAVSCDLPPGAGRALGGPARWLFGGRVSLTQADSRLLEALPGIGPARARAILVERRRAAFPTLGALDRVYGIGPSTVGALAPFLRVDPPDDLVSASAKSDGEG